MEKLNIAEILKDCPSGMELDCPMFENVTFARVDMSKKQFPIEIVIRGKQSKYLTKEGCFHDVTLLPDAKCVIFPKGKTTWDGFQRPFKDGDIVVITDSSGYSYIVFHNIIRDNDGCYNTTGYNCFCESLFINRKVCYEINNIRYANEKEKAKLFQAIKDNSYYWNAETKTLEKLIEPKFKVGDEIVKRNSINNSWIVSSVSSEYYGLKLPEGFEGVGVLPVSEQDDYELLLNTNKFDFTTLKPFNKVLCRQNENCPWIISFFGSYDKEATTNPFICNNGFAYKYCIPYEGNEHLLDKRKNCDEYYKTWK